VSQRVTYKLDDAGVAHVRLVWAERRNAIDPAMVEQLADAVRVCEHARVRAVLLSADGPAFSVGGDMRHFAAHSADIRGQLATMVPAYHETLETLATIDAPVVAAVHGAVAGGGLGLVWCSDIVLAAEGTRFATGFSKLGLSGDGGSSWWLPRLVGLARARQMLIAGAVIDALQAHEWGLIAEVLPPGQLAARSAHVATALAQGPTFTLGRMRRLLVASAPLDLGEALARETAAILECAEQTDAAEGVSSFVEGRTPNFNRRGVDDG